MNDAHPFQGTKEGEGEPEFDRLAILGLGLIGGSLALAARERRVAREIVAFDPNAYSLGEATVLGIIEQGFSDVLDAVDGADAILLAAPVRAILHLLEKIGSTLAPGTFVMDFGSTKGAVVSAMNTLPPGISAVGGHPMAGKEVSGLGAAEARLFDGAVFGLCRTARTDERARLLAERLVERLGGWALWVDAGAHDEAAARISHLPYLLSTVLVLAAQAEGTSRQLAATGYRDTSRLASSDPGMMLDILLTNRSHILRALADVRGVLGRLELLLQGEDIEGLLEYMEEARRQR